VTKDSITESPWGDWRRLTPARLALGRAGSGMPTNEVLSFGWAHAMARDAIHTPLAVDELVTALHQQQRDVVSVRSRASDRTTYLRRPDLGRVLHPDDARALRAKKFTPLDVCIIIGDGLSSPAINRHAGPLLATLLPLLADVSVCPVVVIATQARVALADDIAELLHARLAIMLIGERPGLSSPDSLGVYITHAPYRGRSDADRNCLSNIRVEGLSYETAALRLAWLVREALKRGVTGVDLKDESDHALHGQSNAALPNPI
jgi:ethanolamine ammonia-lyase small subunit